jgi:hypothetical protein
MPRTKRRRKQQAKHAPKVAPRVSPLWEAPADCGHGFDYVTGCVSCEHAQDISGVCPCCVEHGESMILDRWEREEYDFLADEYERDLCDARERPHQYAIDAFMRSHPNECDCCHDSREHARMLDSFERAFGDLIERWSDGTYQRIDDDDDQNAEVRNEESAPRARNR